ncbi:hypothetical protein KC340_g33 [Hortaea werneckii]|nr:hypothetical protein KC340_g33 [Hortaea werneckii]
MQQLLVCRLDLQTLRLRLDERDIIVQTAQLNGIQCEQPLQFIALLNCFVKKRFNLLDFLFSLHIRTAQPGPSFQSCSFSAKISFHASQLLRCKRAVAPSKICKNSIEV